MTGFATVIATTGFCVAIQQLVISKAQLRQATIGAATNMTVLRVRETRESIDSGAHATLGGVQRARGAISARGIEAASALGTAASSLMNGAQRPLSSASIWTASVNPLAFPMPTLNSDSRSLLSLFGNPWSSLPDEGPIISEDLEEPENQGIQEQMGEEPDIHGMPDSRLDGESEHRVATVGEDIYNPVSNFSQREGVTRAESLFSIGSDSDASSISSTSTYMTTELIEDEVWEGIIAARNEETGPHSLEMPTSISSS
jgi:hypothetical protein